MKYLQRLFILLTVSAFVFSCQKEYSAEINTAANTTAQWSFAEGSSQFKGPIDTVTVDTVGSYTFLTINGHSTDNKDQITLQVFGSSIKVGTYKTPYSLFAYLRNGVSMYQTNQTLVDSFTISITKYDSTGITGTFNGKALDTAKNSKTIVNGQFSSVFKTSKPATPVDSGQVVIWSTAGCGGGTSTSPISVSVGTKNGTITQFFTTEPTTCDPAGAFFLTLPVGTYPLVAKCGSDSLTGTVTVLKNTCTKVQVDLTGSSSSSDYFPMTKFSNWSSKYDTVGSQPGDTTFTISSGQTLSANSNTYNVFLYADYAYNYLDTFYYRKSGTSNYYQYYTASSNIFGFDVPTAIEYKFLEDTTVGVTWTTGNINGTISTSPATVRIDGTVISRPATFTSGNIPFTNVIEMRISFYAVSGSVAIESFRLEEWYAKGIGLIKYEELLSPFTSPSTVLNTTRWQIY